MKHNYSLITQQYMTSNGLQKYQMAEVTGATRTVMLTKDELKAWQKRGVNVK